MCLKFSLSPYAMLRTHNIAWRNFCSLFLAINKRGKGVETQICGNSSFPITFVTDCGTNWRNKTFGDQIITIIPHSTQNVSQTKPPEIKCTCSLFGSLIIFLNPNNYCAQKIMWRNQLPIPYVFTTSSNGNMRL